MKLLHSYCQTAEGSCVTSSPLERTSMGATVGASCLSSCQKRNRNEGASLKDEHIQTANRQSKKVKWINIIFARHINTQRPTGAKLFQENSSLVFEEKNKAIHI